MRSFPIPNLGREAERAEPVSPDGVHFFFLSGCFVIGGRSGGFYLRTSRFHPQQIQEHRRSRLMHGPATSGRQLRERPRGRGCPGTCAEVPYLVPGMLPIIILRLGIKLDEVAFGTAILSAHRNL